MSLLKSAFKATARTGTALTAVSAGLLSKFQNNLLYNTRSPHQLPKDNSAGRRDPSEANLKYEDVYFATPDDVILHGWFISASVPSTAPTVIFFQGRSGNIGQKIPFMAALQKHCDVNVFVIGYRGYSYSEGTPTETGLQIDSLAAIDYIFSRKDIDLSKVFVLGKSLGGAVAIYSMSHTSHKVAGVIIENTFSSMANALSDKSRILKFFQPYVLKIKWESIKNVTTIEAPMLFIAGLKDKLIPTLHMQNLYDAAEASAFREKLDIPEGIHHGMWKTAKSEYFKGINDFIERALAHQKF